MAQPLRPFEKAMKICDSLVCRLKRDFRLTTEVASLNTLIGREGMVERAKRYGASSGLEHLYHTGRLEFAECVAIGAYDALKRGFAFGPARWTDRRRQTVFTFGEDVHRLFLALVISY
jgi:hypothetical protein